MTRRVGQLLICFLLLSPWGLVAATPHRVLLIHSFGSDFPPFNAFTRTFRNQLAEQMGEALVLYDADLASARVAGESSEVPFTTYLTQLFGEQQPDLVVLIGGPAVQFGQRHHSRLFPGKPFLISAVDERLVQSSLLATNDAAVCCRSDAAVEIENILRVLPATTNIVVPIGNSPLESLWTETIQRDFQIDRIDELIPPGSDINLYRIIQEGLNNVLKHARATLVSLEVKRSDDGNLCVSIFDDGAGFDLETCRNGKTKVSLGLVSMTERAKLLGGKLDIKSSKGVGTRITLTVPLQPQRHETVPKNDSAPQPVAVLPAPLGGHGAVSPGKS